MWLARIATAASGRHAVLAVASSLGMGSLVGVSPDAWVGPALGDRWKHLNCFSNANQAVCPSISRPVSMSNGQGDLYSVMCNIISGKVCRSLQPYWKGRIVEHPRVLEIPPTKTRAVSCSATEHALAG